MKKNVLLTGKPGVGKTTLPKKLVAGLSVHIGGFYTEEIRSGGRRVGFKIRSFQNDVGFSGEEEVLAHVDSPSPFRVSRYGVNVEAFEGVGVRAIERAILQSDLIVMDELGKMELFSEPFQRTALRALDSPKPVLGVIQSARTPFLGHIRRREDVEVIEVTVENRDTLPRSCINPSRFINHEIHKIHERNSLFQPNFSCVSWFYSKETHYGTLCHRGRTSAGGGRPSGGKQERSAGHTSRRASDG